MLQVNLPFDANLSSVSVRRGHLDQLMQQPAAENREDVANAMQTLDAIVSRLDSIEQMLTSRFDQLREKIAHTAVDVAQTVLNEEDPLIEKRVQHYVHTAFGQAHELVPKNVHVHPKCAAAITGWLKQADRQAIEVIPDKSVSPGDCRVESDEQGLSATLEGHLDVIFQQLLGNGINN